MKKILLLFLLLLTMLMSSLAHADYAYSPKSWEALSYMDCKNDFKKILHVNTESIALEATGARLIVLDPLGTDFYRVLWCYANHQQGTLTIEQEYLASMHKDYSYSEPRPYLVHYIGGLSFTVAADSSPYTKAIFDYSLNKANSGFTNAQPKYDYEFVTEDNYIWSFLEAQQDKEA